LECVEKIIWPFALTEFDALNTSVHRYWTPRHIITAAATTWVWFFGFLDNSQQIYRNSFAWFSLARTHNVLETATSSLIEYGAAAITTTAGDIVVVIAASSRHRSSRHARFRTRHARPLRKHKRRRLCRNSPDSLKFATRMRCARAQTRVASIPANTFIKQA
jgi:hypothetical protein